MLKKHFIILLILVFFASGNAPLFAGSMMPEFICEIGLKFYQQGRNEEALTEFKKALLVQPNYGPALEYIQMIKNEELSEPEPPAEGYVYRETKESPVYSETKVTRNNVIPSRISATGNRPVVYLPEVSPVRRESSVPQYLPSAISPASEPISGGEEKELDKRLKKVIPIEVFKLDNTLSEIIQPIELEQGQSIIISGKSIQRFLVTQQEILKVEKNNIDELLVTGQEIGYTYLYAWDANGRWEIEFLTVPPKPEGPTSEEAARVAEELARDFKLRYSLNWNSVESGRRVKSLRRSSYSWFHSLSLTGPSPYGDIDSGLNVFVGKNSTDLTYFTLGLTKGKLGNFQGFALRGFDYTVPLSNLVLSGAGLKGAMFSSPAFNEKVNYTVFWGRENAGNYGSLSPSLTESKDSFLKGVNLGYFPEKQSYKFTFVQGWGEDREDFLNRYGYDLSSSWNIENWKLSHEIAFDSERFANLARISYQQPEVKITTELRNIDKKFTSITGNGWRQGELGGLFSLNYIPNEALRMMGSLDVFQDRLFPAPENPDRWNEDFNWDVDYKLDSASSVGAAYSLQNDLGKISQVRYQSAGLNYSRKFDFLTDIYTYVNYYHQENKNYSSHASDYINDKIFGGIRVRLIGELYYYANREFNWLQERFTGTRTKPNAFETGIDWSDQLAKTPFYGNLRLAYREEKDTESSLSFLSGEDYIEAYSELAYRPTNDQESYVSCSMRNVWGQDPRVTKRLEMIFNFGMRYLWDTGFHWDSVGNIEGYVFKDFNSDGLKQEGELPIDGAQVWLGKDKSQVTDKSGYYRFTGIKARKAYVSFDTSSLPVGFVLTVPATQEVNIEHHRTAKLDFGVISRSEISGIIFEDTDGNGEFGAGDTAVLNVALSLENGLKAISDNYGRYYFPNVTPGEHTITLDLNSLPLSYLPSISVFKKIDLAEGATYLFNIPLKKQ